MEFLKARRLPSVVGRLKGRKYPVQEQDQLSEPKDETLDAMPKPVAADPSPEGEDDEDDDDFITNEVKRRLKELRKNSFMVLIPEEGYPGEEEEEEGSSSSGWRESEVGDGFPWGGFDTLYDKYCDRMLFFDKMIAQHLKQVGMVLANAHWILDLEMLAVN